jgi:hypothetical protein
MNDKEKIKISLASLLYLLMNSYEPGDNDNVDNLIFSICDFLCEEYGMTKEEIKEIVNGISVQIIEKPENTLLN